MSSSKQSEFPFHRDCVNFRNGLCTLIGTNVDPNGCACPNFTPKSSAETLQTAKAYKGTTQPYQPHLPQTEYGLPILHVYPTWIGYEQGYMQDTGFLFMSGGRRGGGGGRGGGSGGGRGRGRMGGFAAGPGGSCVCPRCGYSTSHAVGTPCYQQTCPKCGSRMTRGS